MNNAGKDAGKLKSCLKPSLIKDIDGKILGKDGNPLRMPIRNTRSITKKESSKRDKPVVSKQSHVDEGRPIDVENNDVEYTKNHKSNLEGINNGVTSGTKKNGTEIPMFVDSQTLNKDGLGSQPNNGWKDHGIGTMQSTPIPSFAIVVNGTNTMRNTLKLNFRAMNNPNKVENSDFVLPIVAIQAMKHMFKNTLIMSDDDGVFYFKFTSAKGLEQVLEQGLWLIRNIPFILTKWTPNLSLSKDKDTKVPGRIGFARALIEVGVDKELKQAVTMVIPKGEEESAGNLDSKRRLLRAELGLHKQMVRGYPWILLRDFNVALNLEDNHSGSSSLNSTMMEFKDYVADIEVMDINCPGLHFTKFLDVLAANWNVDVSGHHMFQITAKLKALKKPLRKLVHDQGNLHDRVNKLTHELDEVQKALDLNPTDQQLREEEAIYVQAFNEAKVDEEFLDQTCSNMVQNVTDVEIKAAMFSIGDDKILKEINHTFIALIPKVSNPHRINDYRPISCCNVIYKCISKILTDRIIKGIKEVVSDNQSAFMPGRHISNNILITQELMHGYHWDKGPPRCAFKIDIQKAYDTVDWRFLGVILKWFGKLGLRQGDPLLAYLFTLVMEVLTLILKKHVRASESFRGDVDSARVIMESLEEFKRASSLVPSLPKSTAYFCNVVNHVKIAILNIIPFYEGKLPVIYLGVPLISTRLFNRDCKFLVEKAKNRIGDWKNKSLSFAGRVQLCKSVISSMHVYWASVLMIPTGILLDIEQLIHGFLWCNGELKHGKAKIGNGHGISAWFDVWCEECPLICYLSHRDISREGFNLKTTIGDLVSNEGWNWPQSWLLKAPTLGQIPTPLLAANMEDTQWWRNSNGVLSKFSVKAA
ncbi:hypothetical protein Tco_1023473 [Tanacetum coccineum]